MATAILAYTKSALVSISLSTTEYYKCCGSILSLVQILFSFLLGMVIYDNEFKTKGNKNRTKDKIEPQHRQETLKETGEFSCTSNRSS